jgi:putative ABC transport system substrate-binding protein
MMGARTHRTLLVPLAALFLAGGAAVGCLKPLKPVLVRAVPDATSSIVVLKSSDNPMFDQPLTSFIEGCQATVTVFSQPEAQDPKELVAAVSQLKPELIFTLGTKATLVARDLFPDTPILFAMVVNYRRHNLAGHSNIMGVALEASPSVEFVMFKMIVPHLSKVLVIHTAEGSGDLVAEARAAVEPLGVSLVAESIADVSEVETAYRARSAEVDSVWFINDPVVMNPNTFSYLKAHTIADRLAFVSSLSSRFAQDGALMSASVDLTSLGAQAAAIARQVHEGVSPAQIGVQSPIGSKLAVNLDVATAIGLAIPGDVLPFVSEVFESAGIHE